MESSGYVRRNERVVFRELTENEGGVLLHLDTGAYHGLNPIGTLIWRLIDDGSTTADLVAGVRSQLSEGPEELEADVIAFVEDLVQRDLLTRVEA